ncbi:hypothetical protein EZS27_022658 [termite gut metagenome]|uniref:Uncharacterized protein n=1 Tax=termite gut metagenome TaxID=433724 RepID=A0A5J4R3G7_9ZZZZ
MKTPKELYRYANVPICRFIRILVRHCRARHALPLHRVNPFLYVYAKRFCPYSVRFLSDTSPIHVRFLAIGHGTGRNRTYIGHISDRNRREPFSMSYTDSIQVVVGVREHTISRITAFMYHLFISIFYAFLIPPTG